MENLIVQGVHEFGCFFFINIDLIVVHTFYLALKSYLQVCKHPVYKQSNEGMCVDEILKLLCQYYED